MYKPFKMKGPSMYKMMVDTEKLPAGQENLVEGIANATMNYGSAYKKYACPMCMGAKKCNCGVNMKDGRSPSAAFQMYGKKCKK